MLTALSSLSLVASAMNHEKEAYEQQSIRAVCFKKMYKLYFLYQQKSM